MRGHTRVDPAGEGWRSRGYVGVGVELSTQHCGYDPPRSISRIKLIS